MTDVDFSSPQHRLDNLTNMRFVRAYARVRHQVTNWPADEGLAAFLIGYMSSMEDKVALEMQLPVTSLVGRLVDLGRDLCEFKDANDEGESATG